ncbi:MAG: EAL domain-containing protein [Pseudomonadota bacterium]
MHRFKQADQPAASNQATGAKQAPQSAFNLNLLLSNLPGMAYRCIVDNSVWNMEFVSAGARDLTGYDAGDLTGNRGHRYAEIIVPEDRKRVRDEMLAAFSAGLPFQIKYRIVTASGEPKWVREHGNAVRGAAGELLALEGFIFDITVFRRAQQALRESEERFKHVAKATADAIWDWDLLSDTIWWNEGMQNLFGFTADEIEPDSQSWTRRIHAEDKERVLRGIHAVIDGDGEAWTDEYRFLRKDGSYAYVLDRGRVIRNNGKPVRMLGGMADLSERKLAQLEIIRINRALQMRSRCSEVLIRATDEQQLLADVCRLAVEIGGYRMAWVGMAQHDEESSILPAAHFGENAGYLKHLRLSWSDRQPHGLGPAGRAIRSGRAVVLDDLAIDEESESWRASARQRGFRGIVCLPLRDRDDVLGVLTLLTAGHAQISSDELDLLQALADDLAFGIINMRAQEERRRLQAATAKVAAGVSASGGTAFFTHLVRNMVEATGAQAGVVSRTLPGYPSKARTIAVVVDGSPADNFDYAIDGSPCQELYGDPDCVVRDKLGQRFPQAAPLVPDAQSYVGRRLDNSTGQAIGMLFVIFRDPVKESDFITSTLQIFGARVAAELERQEADSRIRDQASLLDNVRDAIIVRGLDYRILFWNRGAERLYGWSSEEAVGRLINDLFDTSGPGVEEITGQVLEHGEWTGEVTQLKKNGEAMMVEAHMTLVKDVYGVPNSILSITNDITQRNAAQAKIQNLAFYDPLTQLPNRLLLMERLQHAMSISARTRKMGALLFIDLDNFKTLNDTLGHDKGDLLLQQVGLRLAACVRESDTVARLGGDEFVVMLEELSENAQEAAAQTETVGEKILTTFNQPFQLAGHGHFSTPSIGVTLFSGQSNSVDELLKRADLAMYQAKAEGRNAIRFFDPEMQTAVTARVALEADFRRGLQRQEFFLEYQPQLDEENRVIGAEALVRWRHPARGLVTPNEFICLAEETGLILPLGLWVLQTACDQLASWAAQPETAYLNLSVNVSARQFRHLGFVEQALAVIDRTGINPQRLKLELTESLLVDNVEETIAKMATLKARGIGFALDDFGTGYSSLSYLKRLPLDQLKIDRTFVSDVLTDANDAVIVRTIVALGQSLGLLVIAEGVETIAQRDFLARQGCHVFQGYLYSQPLTAEQFEDFIRCN